MRGGHTPGPWRYQPTAGNHDYSVYAEQGNGRDVALVREFHEGNARLIAAAPDLLAFVAEYARVSCECDDVPGGCGPCRARALLARIEGGQ